MAEEHYYRVERVPPLAWVFLDRPDKRNAMGPPAWRDSPGVFDALDGDAEIRAVVVAGEGSCFGAGIDLMAMAPEVPELMEADQRGGTKWRLLRRIEQLQETMSCVERCRKPVIAAVHGACIGAALDLATACDIRLCAADAVFSVREVALGFVADVGVLQRLPRIVGQGLARELAFTAADIDAERALAIGLVNAVYPDRATLLDAAEALARQIADNAPLAVQASKLVLNHGAGRTVEDGLCHVASLSANIIPSADLMEAMQAFAEKRKPRFSGR